MEEAAPSLVVLGQLNKIEEVFLVAESQVMCKINPKEAPLLILGAFTHLTWLTQMGFKQCMLF